ncbi:winged helix-turn-helix transcriptional regulator [Amycolatopsis acidicola]|uniref:Winged helix-turn-helix transcriptional regulator n=1 Tax=Amycolatopsis acidicola TaxID=2596893 RepID=A0A5N0VBE8_9PSEU|nr:winged helix-turn-helix domain-containing protein [Amycolatopsis acidicola]KAA9162593.1 winged helix-turn-helix transcriptional regulator [Amycolatopsis acidicola]
MNRGPGYVYERVADDLEDRIRSGELAPGTALPNENDLAREYGVSVGTSRHATKLLRERGLVTTIRCKGTYVTPVDRWSKPGENQNDTSHW